ncbi:hypothetical protein JCM8115_004877 [Rhodotorula mucilaginosa]|uniref:Uncharacterized protein n=1 Tax=Rhodotorula mucilaginosa TaxID=5537 RepID=A0A9P7B7A6_RHOMI|nr:hypothetical protein C6P46_003437 [Rhodotorula mucilaginosa]TKA57193.1 hypothetical protein B0A53_01149 [Rhodotorula sp. CCFEE 5036]
MPPKSASPRKATATKVTNDPTPLPLPALLKLLCSSGPKPPHLTMSQAIAAASKLVPKGYTSPAKLKTLTQVEMSALGIADEEIRKGLMAVIGKAGGKGAGDSPEVRRKRTRESDLDRPLPSRAPKETTVDEDFDFDEIEAEEALAQKSCLVNRAPVMTAWACVVAERLGFKRQEALSIAHVFTDMNAASKGVSLGIYGPEANKIEVGPSQPFVDILGRKVPVLSTQNGEWRAISKGHVADPSKAFAYMRGAFRQQLGAVIGSMRLLAASFPQHELNAKGYGLYLEFRPDVDGWGKKAELKMSTILDLRRHLTHAQPESSATAQESLEEQSTSREVKQEVDGQEGVVQVKPEPVDESDHLAAAGPPSPSPPKKKVKAEPHESEPPLSSKNEFDVLLEEDDDLFAAIDI